MTPELFILVLTGICIGLVVFLVVTYNSISKRKDRGVKWYESWIKDERAYLEDHFLKIYGPSTPFSQYYASKDIIIDAWLLNSLLKEMGIDDPEITEKIPHPYLRPPARTQVQVQEQDSFQS